MKKVILVLTALVCIAMATPVFAAQTFNGLIGTTAAVSTTIGGAVYVPSTGVYVNVAAITTAYCVTSVHNSALGSTAGKAYGSTSNDATIFSGPAPAANSTIVCANPNPTSSPQAVLPTGVTWQ